MKYFILIDRSTPKKNCEKKKQLKETLFFSLDFFFQLNKCQKKLTLKILISIKIEFFSFIKNEIKLNNIAEIKIPNI